VTIDCPPLSSRDTKGKPTGEAGADDDKDDVRLSFPEIEDGECRAEDQRTRQERRQPPDHREGELHRRRRDKADDSGGYALEKGMQVLIVDHLLQVVVQEQREAERRQEDADRHRHGPERTTAEVADEGREDNQRRRKDPGRREPVKDCASVIQPLPTASSRRNGITV
jgi:hypothetical protein